ncbi:MAG: hypothetical protein JWM33_949 [Caulobacteraceae bacterium]|nr:hypothetical protein [Caulobacteraceae bacterium]
MDELEDDRGELRLRANRPEAWRYVRLARIFQDAERAADKAGQFEPWVGALCELEDLKGDATAVWRSQGDLDRFADLVTQAWVDAGEKADDIYHVVIGDK